jgi:isoleucyl-tRNA synthetase
MAEDKKDAVSFKTTLNLPQTEFPIRANAAQEDAVMLARWQEQKLSAATFEHNKGRPMFILHDGPPYANGHIHIGHAYNKSLKDFVTKSQRMFGYHVPVTPGWDCHGLPIELKVAKENPDKKGAELKKACRVYAQSWIDIQRAEFIKLGVLMDWEHPYVTMAYDYESSILKAFGEFVAGGYIERKNKTVPWCPSCETVLASAEIEYEDRKDPSLYVRFPLESEAVKNLFPALAGKEVSMLIWTTTPWTLPLNRAVLIKPGARYQVLEVNSQLVVVGAALADKLCTLLGIEKKVVADVVAEKFAEHNVRAQHPFIAGRTVPVILDDQAVTLEDGTACVHCAPGCGPIDYEVGVKNKLEIFSPLSTKGTYTVGIEPQELEGMAIADGQIWVIKKLAERDVLLHKASLRHSYPHCWRCHGPLMFRATKQWFCDLEKHNLKERALEAIESIQMLPETAGNRLSSAVEGRLEWCLSRQRTWGVPIPAFLCSACDATYCTKDLIDRVAAGVAEHGVEYWDTVAIEELVVKDFACPSCGGTTWTKEKDILDVWFDSGVSHYAVLKNRSELDFPADMYLEGKDQTRGWFQSSLLTGMVLEGSAPMISIATHGFSVDAQGKKMSKSIGNTVSPEDLLAKLGTDGLRLYFSSIDMGGDLVISDTLIKNVQEVYRKIRNTSRFLLSNLYDYSHERDAVAFGDMRPIDRAAMERLFVVNNEILMSYQQYDFTAVYHALTDYCTVDLSSYYLDIIKDRLYVEKADGQARRSAQTVCWHILDTMTRLIAPMLSFTAEQIADHYQGKDHVSIHLQEFAMLESLQDFLAPGRTVVVDHGTGAHGTSCETGCGCEDDSCCSDSSCGGLPEVLGGVAGKVHDTHEDYAEQGERAMAVCEERAALWTDIKTMRSAVLKSLEGLREQGIIKHSLEARVTLSLDQVLRDKLVTILGDTTSPLPGFAVQVQPLELFWQEYVIVSQVFIAPTADGLTQTDVKGLAVKAERAEGDKCPRCWQWSASSDTDKLCTRCAGIVR